MKKGIQESNPVLALWQKVILDGRIPKLAKEYRVKIKIPADGFNTFEEFEMWHNELEDTKSTDILELNLGCFIQDSKNIIPYEGIIRDISFKVLMFKFLIFAKVENDYLNSLKNSGMRIVTVKNSKLFYPPMKEIIGEIEDGVYIKIKDFSTINHIIEYIQSNKNYLRNSLQNYAESEKIIKPKRIKLSSNFERDLKINLLNQYTKEELEKYSGIKAKDKNIIISLVMKELGLKVKGDDKINTDIVKIVKQRSKLKK